MKKRTIKKLLALMTAAAMTVSGGALSVAADEDPFSFESVSDVTFPLKEKLELTYVFITHDLTSVTYLCDEVMFLYKGRITEHIPVSRIAQTTDVYARKLLDSIIEFDEEYDDEMDVKESEESA